MYLQQANQKDMLIMSLLISQSPTEMLDFLYSKWKKKKILLFQICNDIYFIKHQMQVCSYKISNVF